MGTPAQRRGRDAMADHLPEDPRHWPRDPFELLGVGPSATETDLRRAYTRLSRRFKPEHSPEAFRRVREAYEAALQHRKWFQVFPTEFPRADDEPSPVVVTARDAPPEPAAPEEHAAPSEPEKRE